MKRLAFIFATLLIVAATGATAQDSVDASAAIHDSLIEEIMAEDSLDKLVLADAAVLAAPAEDSDIFKVLKQKYIEGNPYFMSLVALALIIGLAICFERIVYLSLARINAKRFMADFEDKMNAGKIEEAREQCLNTRGPVAALCLRGLERIDGSMDHVERSVVNYGATLVTKLEKGCSWITLFISIAPTLGFLGTVIGMVMAFDNISIEGDINPTIVADGMKVALITTIFGIIVAVILQVFYNYIISRIERITQETEESAIVLLDVIARYKSAHEGK